MLRPALSYLSLPMRYNMPQNGNGINLKMCIRDRPYAAGIYVIVDAEDRGYGGIVFNLVESRCLHIREVHLQIVVSQELAPIGRDVYKRQLFAHETENVSKKDLFLLTLLVLNMRLNTNIL